jgi:hypothetical protein
MHSTFSEIVVSKRPLRAILSNSGSMKELCVESAARDGNYRILPLNSQQTFN